MVEAYHDLHGEISTGERGAPRALAHVARRAEFSFWSAHKFPTRRRAIYWEISLRSVKGPDSGARNELIMGNGRRSRPANSGFSSRPLPLIGVRRVIVQCRAHDDDRAAPALAPGTG